MKVKELAEFVEKETYFNVTHNEKMARWRLSGRFFKL